ncbi:hypothetical protein [Butyrivibrio sp. TB]|uniref:hypothetical protein n=1 Tax=Butyrivibrio sp. TB TaxID=1520809 RepID=UPI0008BE67C5|nr:hypothetical protein [Butyrivibrio sp. TB]SEP95178.1 hypothetical protein SAMN02910382_01521 [Butyrivibrio sp. TB]
MIKLKSSKSKYIILALILLIIALGIFRKCFNTTTIMIMTPNDLIVSEDGLEYYDDSHDSFEISDHSAVDNVIATQKMQLDKGKYQFLVSYVTDSEDNTCELRSINEMDDTGKKGVVYASSSLPSDKNGVILTADFPNDVTDVELVVNYQSGSLKIGQIHMQNMSKDFDALWFYLFAVASLLIVAYIYNKLKNVNDEDGLKIFALLLGLIIYMSFPLMNDFLIMGHDIEFHLGRIRGIYRALNSGSFPMWLNMFQSKTYGYASSIMYPQLFLYIPAGFMCFGMSLMNAYKIFYVLNNVASVFIAYVSFKRIFKDRNVGLIVTFGYNLGLYHLSNIYTRAAIGEFLAMTFMPLFAYAIYELYVGDYKNKWIYLTASITGILQSHVLSTYICVFFAAITFVILLPRIKSSFLQRLLEILKAAIISLLINLFFIVPFLSFYGEDFFVKTVGDDTIYSEAAYLSQIFAIFIRAPFLSQKLGTTKDEMPLSLGLVLFIGIVLSIIFIAKHYKEWIKSSSKSAVVKECIYYIVLSIISIYMCLWCFPWRIVEKIPVLNILCNIQFTWRMLSPATLFASLVLGCVIIFLRWIYPRPKVIYGIAILLITLNSLYYMENVREMDTAKNKVFASVLGTSDWLYSYADNTQSVLEDRGNIVTSSEEGTVITNFYKSQDVTSFDYALPKGVNEAVIDIPLYYYPKYMIYTDGKVSDADRSADGFVSTKVYENKGTIEVRYTVPAIWNMSYIISLIAVISCFVYIVSRYIRRQRAV